MKVVLILVAIVAVTNAALVRPSYHIRKISDPSDPPEIIQKSSMSVAVETEKPEVTTSSAPATNSFSQHTGLISRIKKNSCRCVGRRDRCDVEMMEETVVKVEGSACRKYQRYCCERETIKMSDNSTLQNVLEGVKNRLTNDLSDTLLRDEISSTGDVTPLDNEINNNPKVYIQPSTLGAILRLLTEGFKFMSQFFE